MRGYPHSISGEDKEINHTMTDMQVSLLTYQLANSIIVL